MITITKQIYEEIAELLLEKIREKDFFNGTVEYDTDEFYSSLTCTLIICRAPETGIILSVLPVWWNYDIALIDGEQQSDFQLEHPEPIPRKPVLNIGDPAL